MIGTPSAIALEAGHRRHD